MKYAQIDETGQVLAFQEFENVPDNLEKTWIPFDFPDATPPHVYYYDGNTCRLKTSIPFVINKKLLLADAKDSVVITGLPKNTQIYFEEFVWEDDCVEFVTDSKGRYTITLEHTHYNPVTVAIEAV